MMQQGQWNPRAQAALSDGNKGMQRLHSILTPAMQSRDPLNKNYVKLLRLPPEEREDHIAECRQRSVDRSGLSSPIADRSGTS